MTRWLTAVVALALATAAACTAPPPPASVSSAASHSGAGTQTRRSGFADMSPATQAMQRDDSANPAWLWVEEGRQRFASTCARCHTVAAMAGVAARYPAWDTQAKRPLTLGQRISACHVRHAGGGALAPDSDARLALEAFVALQSRGLAIEPSADERLVPWRERGRALFRLRQGQLDLSCEQCHDRRAGRRLAGSVIPQGHPTGYPIYRLEWQGMGSLQRRMRGCLTGVRAEPFAADGDDSTALEVYLAWRAGGMAIETPAVRP